ncbi:MAG: DUF4199 domain-containing protein [Prevotella sp.]|nr:DUF4199 domain-containing protein [Prevotella sp.]
MTAQEYIQLRAYARVDGLKLFVLWLISFVCYIVGLRQPVLGMVGTILALVTPFYVYRLLRQFRDGALDGVISFGRSWVFVVFLFFYASLLFAIAQFVYFNWMDNGYFAETMMQMFSDPASMAAIKQMGMTDTLNEAMAEFNAMRPIDMVLNILTSNMLIGCIIGLPIAAIVKRDRLQQIK